MKQLFVLLFGALIGVSGMIYLDRNSDYRPFVDKYVEFVYPAEASLASDGQDAIYRAMESNSITTCFERNAFFQTSPPNWLKRDPLGPLTSAQIPAYPLPNPSAFPGMVKIEQILSPSGAQRHHCAATRIDRNWFLTASHCIKMKGDAGPVVDMLIVEPRTDVMQEDTRLFPIDGAVCHSAWYSRTGKFDDDIALVHVKNVAGLDDVAVAMLDTAAAPLSDGDYQNAYFAGWGKNGRNRFLQGSELSITMIGETFVLGDNRGAFAPCVGDSGGPLYVGRKGNPRVVGVLSSVTNDACPPFDRAFYTRVKTFEHWIRTAARLCHQDDRFVCGISPEHE